MMSGYVVRWFRRRAVWIWAVCAAALGLAAACQDVNAPPIIPWSVDDTVQDSTKTGMLLIVPANDAGVWV